MEEPVEVVQKAVIQNKTPEHELAQTSIDDDQPVTDDSPELAQTSDDRVKNKYKN